jgi:hypothetical protein
VVEEVGAELLEAEAERLCGVRREFARVLEHLVPDLDDLVAMKSS